MVWGTDALTNLSLPALATVTGGGFDIVDSAALSTVSLPVLTTVQGDVSLAPLDTVDLPQLVTVGGDLSLGGTSVSLPALESVGGTLGVMSAAIPALSLPELASIGGDLWISQDGSLASLSLPALADAGGLVLLQWLPALGALDLGALATAGAGLNVVRTGLTQLELPALLTVGPSPFLGSTFAIEENAELASISAPQLTSVAGGFRVVDNAKLPQCEAEALRDQLTTFAGAANITGNDTIATCP
jgi:hypothetical protein